MMSLSSGAHFLRSAVKGALLIAAVAAGAAMIGLLVYGIGYFFPSVHGHWPLNDVRVQLTDISKIFMNGAAWIAYFCIAGLALFCLAFLGGFRGENRD